MLLAISANDIDAAGLPVDASLPPAWLEAELADAQLRAKAPGHLQGRLSRSGTDVVVRARVTASLTTSCARCLDPAEVPIDTELSLLLRPAAPPPRPSASSSKHAGANGSAKPKAKAKPKEKEEEYEFTSAEADVDTFDGETVVLDPFVREAILLEVPNFPLCSEACPGIRSAPGEPASDASRPLDPRLAPLAAITLEGAPPPRDPPREAPSAPQKQKKTKKE